MNTTTYPAPCSFISPADALARAAEIAGAVRLADVKSTPTKWLWPGRIPLGRVTLLTSDPGLGKSLVTLDIAARVSAGKPWPDHGGHLAPRDDTRLAERDDHHSDPPSPFLPPPSRPGSVLLLTSEDDLADTIRPRLESLGADCDRILAISHVPGENNGDVPRAFALNRDLSRLTNLLDAIPDCRLLIVDPISAFLGTANEHGNAEVRTLLAALATIARQRNLAVLIVSHLRKKEGAALYRTMGSLAFIAAARAAWIICKDPADPLKRLMLPLKNNLAPDVAGLAYTIETCVDHDAPIIRWTQEAIAASADTSIAMGRNVGRPNDECRHAANWLEQRLSREARAARELKEEADACGISYATLRRAFRELGGEAARQGVAPFNRWVWKLPGTPETTAQNTGGEFWTPFSHPDDLAAIFQPWMPPHPPQPPPPFSREAMSAKPSASNPQAMPKPPHKSKIQN